MDECRDSHEYVAACKGSKSTSWLKNGRRRWKCEDTTRIHLNDNW